MNIPAGEFKAKCLKLIDEVREFHTEVIITKYGKPVAKLVPVQDRLPRSAFGYLKGTVVSANDLVAPTGECWNADA